MGQPLSTMLTKLTQWLFLAILIPVSVAILITTLLIFSVGFAVILLMLVSAIF